MTRISEPRETLDQIEQAPESDEALWQTRDPAAGARQGSAFDPASLIGAVVADRYRVDKLLGEGGIGRVYRALHVQLGRPIALKLLHPELSGRHEMHLRFQREAQAASRLSHVGSVMVFDFGSWNQMLYLAMELVEGRSLDDVIRADSPLSLTRVVDLGAQLCDALSAAHELGLLHRDLKPENVLVTRGPDGHELAKICDYGLAYLIGEESLNSPRLTREGTVAGTPSFMAPEQIMNRPLDQRADIYALGCVLYEMICGRAPFDGDAPMEILTKQLYDEPEPPSHRALQQVPRELEQAVLWALKKNPANRPQHCAELKAALLAVIEPGRRSERPSNVEVQILTDREARADFAGIAPPPARVTSEYAPSTIEVPVVALAEVAPERTALAILRAEGSSVRSATDLEQCAGAEAIVVDLRGATARGLQALSDGMTRLRWLAAVTIVVVGPDDDFAVMARALELQCAEYIPDSLIATLPRKLHRAVERARRSRS